MRGRASHLRALLSRALSPSLPPRGRALPQVLGGSPPSLACVERWISARPCGSGAEMFGAGFLGRARFFFSDAAAATQGGSKPPAPAEAGSAGGEGGGDGQSGKSEQANTGKAVRGGPVSWLSFLLLLVTGGGIIVYYDKEKKRHIEDLKMKDMDLVKSYHAYHRLLQQMSESKCHGCIKLKEHISLMKEQKMYKDELNKLQFQMSDEALQQMPEFQGRIDVLKVIDYIDSDLVVQLKGRVACEMNSGEELISTECLFENQLDDLEPEETVAIMSAFVFQQRNASEPSLTPKLAEAKKRLYDTAIKLGKLQADFKVPVDPEEYARDNLKFGLVEVVYEWAKGTPFADICELTDVSEGIIVRTIVRLDETCREFRNAASIMGNSALFKKMEIASNAIKRDIVFAASLYVTGI